MVSIRPIPPTAAAQITASVHLTTLNEAVMGLLVNSLDAESEYVRVEVDYRKGGCSVLDNGRGIEAAEFTEAGGLTKRSHTSKSGIKDTHGYKGIFLACLGDLSLMTITSKCHRNTATLTMHNGHRRSVAIPSHPTDPEVPTPSGTHVVIHDLFGSMPVRLRQRPTTDSTQLWTSLLWTIGAFLISWPHPVKVTIKETLPGSSGKTRMVTFRPLDEKKLAKKVPALLRQTSFGLAGAPWEEVSAKAGPFIVKGAIAPYPSATRRPQFISVGVVPLDRDRHPIFYSEINKTFTTSNFSLTAAEDQSFEKPGSRPEKRKSRKSAVEKWPMFFFLVVCPEDMGRPEKVLETPEVESIILGVLRTICEEFLRKMGFTVAEKTGIFAARETGSLPKGNGLVRTPSVAGSVAGLTAKKSIGRSTSGKMSPFDSWSRIKAGQPQKPTIKPNVFPKMPLVNNSGKLTRPPFDASKLPTVRRPTTPTSSETTPKQSMQNVISTWKNPVFPLAQPLIPLLKEIRSFSASERPIAQGLTGKDGAVQLDVLSVGKKNRLSKEALKKAKILGQVDEKFILVTVEAEGKDGVVVVVVDQHAVDERVKVEELMSGYFDSRAIADREIVQDILKFELLEKEFILLSTYQKHFHRWGIDYLLTPPTTLTITTLPPSIYARCLATPSLLITLLRSEIHHLDGAPAPLLYSPTASSSSSSWVPRFSGCPAGIADLLNSRACRSAVMFNDVLERGEMEELMARVARCVFPFQCAHGRPGMVPVVEVRGSLWGGDGVYEEGKDTVVTTWTEYLKEDVIVDYVGDEDS